jgi:hypothetical protein
MKMTNNKAKFANGDVYGDHFFDEDGQRFYVAVDQNGNEYETTERPVLRIEMSLPKGVWLTQY